ncbi:NAD(P)-binding protein [Aspergillus steynii IBT 23096]|uniref:NAD(P)-binding protein n=1 Tax=Aspergillus steynii IBT 23096 TaxID=1392250 RepID=A0A2I2GA98_9EURO|nr:NAD(P)-binding protein [Aspergillus steynii IBT 23096]PLB49805.1 NAD(P)-binding protein [Aspergillus steynii IBT 23096]
MTIQAQKVALFGANGRVGNALLHALVNCKEQRFEILAFISPMSTLRLSVRSEFVTSVHLDISSASPEEIGIKLQGVDIVLSALGGNLLDRQRCIQDGAALAGVKRFYPSEFGMCQIPIFPGSQPILHPTWLQKLQCLESAIRHPAVRSGKMTYTVIGCGELFDAPGEDTLCPWHDSNAEDYTLYVVGNPDALMDYSSVKDVAEFLVSTICHPEYSENRILGFRGDHTSFSEVASSLKRHSGRSVSLKFISFEDAENWITNPSLIPKDVHFDSGFPGDFLLLLRYVQGQGIFWRPRGQFQDHLLQREPLSVDEYFQALFSKNS